MAIMDSPAKCALAVALAAAMSPYLAAGPAAAGKLDDIRSEVEGDGAGDDGDDGDEDDDGGSIWDNDDDDDDYGGSGVSVSSSLGMLVLDWLAWPWMLPHLLAEGQGRTAGFFTHAPYGKGSPGYMTVLTAEEIGVSLEQGDPLPGKSFHDNVALALGLGYAYDLDGVHEPRFSVAVDTSFRLGFRTSWTVLLEPMAGSAVDSLTLGEMQVTVRHVQHEHVQMCTGAGLRLMLDGPDATPGFTFLYGMEAFPVKPLVISATVDLGSLGKAFVVHGSGSLGLTFAGVEIRVGYEAWQIGRVVMHGPLAGIVVRL